MKTALVLTAALTAIHCISSAGDAVAQALAKDVETVSIEDVPQSTRVVPRHVYDARKNTTGFSVPRGYKSVWTDGRLNPRRAEQTLRPSRIIYGGAPPAGYRRAWNDGRLNLNRRARTRDGDARSQQIWTQEIPYTLVEQPTGVRLLTVPRDRKDLTFPYFGTRLPDLPPEAARGPVSAGGSR